MLLQEKALQTKALQEKALDFCLENQSCDRRNSFTEQRFFSVELNVSATFSFWIHSGKFWNPTQLQIRMSRLLCFKKFPRSFLQFSSFFSVLALCTKKNVRNVCFTLCKKYTTLPYSTCRAPCAPHRQVWFYFCDFDFFKTFPFFSLVSAPFLL